MKITKKTVGMTTFKDLNVGDWFLDSDGDVAMKTSCTEAHDNCIYFTEEGEYNDNFMCDDDYVRPVEVELVITDKG